MSKRLKGESIIELKHMHA